MATIKLKPGNKPRALRGHPWVFASEIQKLLPPSCDGEAVECRDAHGHLLGSGLYNSRSQILWRKFSSTKTPLDAPLLETLIRAAIARRNDEPVRRLVWSEADSLPGLIADQYGKNIVLQTLTLGMDRRLDTLVSIVRNLLNPAAIVIRNDVSARALEGLEETVFTAYGDEPVPYWQKIGAIEFYLDLLHGQKTGFYLDQREQYSRVAALAKNRAVLDAFCNQGGFALHCARASAREVLGIDSSQDAVALAQKNAAHNQLAASFQTANVFDFFRAQKNKMWNLIILDPPPFAKNKQKLAEAARGYKELNLRALQRLTPGGILATYACSHHVSTEMFSDILADAAADARRTPRILEFVSQSRDHPAILTIPETQYLRGFILEVE